MVTLGDAEEPDGICVDAEGGVWVSVWNGWSVRRYDEAGRETERVELPAAQVTSCAFGRDHLEQLFNTTVAKGTSGQGYAGGLFAVRPGVRGRVAFSAQVMS